MGKKSLGVELTDIKESNGVISFLATINGNSSVTEISTDVVSGEIYDIKGVKVGSVNDGNLPSLIRYLYNQIRNNNKESYNPIDK